MRSLQTTFGLLLILVQWSPAQEAGKRVSRAEAAGAVVYKTEPEYPFIAKQLKLQGSVELEAVIAENGTVEKVNVLSGNPVLTKPAAESLKKWKFKPFLADGKPARVVAPVSMLFKPNRD